MGQQIFFVIHFDGQLGRRAKCKNEVVGQSKIILTQPVADGRMNGAESVGVMCVWVLTININIHTYVNELFVLAQIGQRTTDWAQSTHNCEQIENGPCEGYNWAIHF
jgi:hypothetical protein